jgi:branched-subunit amino acid aminotransferase/4-amino-4-deoxychorismate lyase
MLVFLNGQFLPEAGAFVPVNDRGFMLGDGLFETMRVVNGGPFRFAQHLERMTRGADFMKIKPPFTPRELEKFAAQLIEQNKMPDAILRVTLTRGPGQRGYTPDNDSQTDSRDDVACCAAAGKFNRMESRHVVVSDSGERRAFVFQDDEQNFERHGARRGGGKGCG